MESHRRLVVMLAALCLVGQLAEGQIFFSQLAKFPGEVSPQYVARFNRFGLHLRDARPIDEKFLESGRDLAKELTRLSNGGKNLRATIMLMHLHGWSTKAFLQAKLFVDAAVEIYLYEKLCRENFKHCAATKTREMVELELSKCKPNELLGLREKGGKPPNAALQAEAKKALTKYRRILHPDKNMHLDEETRKRIQDLYMKVQESYNIVIAQSNEAN